MKNTLNEIHERRDKILSYINERTEVTVDELATIMQVTKVTIRKDLAALESLQKIERCFGGARNINAYNADSLSDADTSRLKKSIAKATANLISHDDVVLVNSSTTASYVIEYLNEKAVTIISNNTNLINRHMNPNTILILTGGQFIPGRSSLSGTYAKDIISMNHATKCVIGVRGISISSGITSPVLAESSINRLMLEQTIGTRIAIASSDKIGKNDSFHICDLSMIDVLVTDSGISAEDIDLFKNHGLQVIIAEDILE